MALFHDPHVKQGPKPIQYGNEHSPAAAGGWLRRGPAPGIVMGGILLQSGGRQLFAGEGPLLRHKAAPRPVRSGPTESVFLSVGLEQGADQL